MRSSLIRKLHLLTILILFCLTSYAGKINFVSLSNFNDKKATLRYYNQDSTIFDSTTTIVDRSEACFTIPDGEWNLSLSLPNYILLRYKGVISDSSNGTINKLSFSQVYISGELPYSLNIGTYIIDSNISIPSHSTVIIPEGTSLFFNEETHLDVFGQLIAQGSESLPVTFRNNNNNLNWDGIVLKNSPLSILNYCSIINTRTESIIADNSKIESLNININRSSNYKETSDSLFSIIQILNQSNIELYKADINGARFPVTNSILYIENSGATISESKVHNLLATKGSIISCNAGSLNIKNCVLSNKHNGRISSISCSNTSANSIIISNSIIYNSSSYENAQGIYLHEKPFTTSISNNIIYNTTLTDSTHNTHLEGFGVNVSSDSFIDKHGNFFDKPIFQDSTSYKLTAETAPIKNLSSVQIVDDSPIPVPSNYIGVHKYLLIDAENFFSSWSSIPSDTDIFFDAGANYADENFLNDDTIQKRYFLLQKNDNITIKDIGNKTFKEEIYPQPKLETGENMVVCENQTFAQLTNATARQYTYLEWITDGDGQFDNPRLLHPKYTFGSQDKARGYVTLTLTAYNGTPIAKDKNDLIIIIEKFKHIFKNNQNLYTTCSEDSVTIQTISGEKFYWSTGSTESSIKVKPSTTNYSLTVTDGQCVQKINSIIVLKVNPYNGFLEVNQNFDSVQFKLSGILYPKTTELNWFIDDTLEYFGNDFHMRFKNQGKHSLCLNIAEETHNCYDTVCKDFQYNLPKDSIGGQIYIDKYPVKAAKIYIYRYFNGDFILADTLKTDNNGFFYQTDLPIGYYTIKAELLPSDPSYNDGYYGATYRGNTLYENEAIIIKHTTSKTWGQNIRLQVSTPTKEIQEDKIKIIPNQDFTTFQILSTINIESVEIVSNSGVIIQNYENINSKEFAFDSNNINSGVYYIKVQTYSKEIYSKSIIKL